MAGENQSQADLARKVFLRGMTAADADGDQTDATDNAAAGGILVSLVASGGSAGAVTVTDGTDTMLVNSDGTIGVVTIPRDAELHTYAATASAAAGTVIATITPTVVGVYEVTINARITAGSSGEFVLDNMQLRNNGVAAMRLLTGPVAISSAGEQWTYRCLVNWTTGAIDVTQVATATAANNTYRVSISAKRVS